MGFILVGLLVGALSGFLGVGGGVFVVPMLTMFFGFSQKEAVGTSIGMLLPPIGLFAFLAYWRAGLVDLSAAGLLAGGFVVGALAGSWMVVEGWIPDSVLRRLFAFFLLYVAGMLLFRGESEVWAAAKTMVLMAVYGAAYWAARLAGRRWKRTLSAPDLFRRQSGDAPEDYDI